jgi:hypothetical protein
MRLSGQEVIFASFSPSSEPAPQGGIAALRRTRIAIAVAAAMMLPAVSHGLGLGRAIGEPVLGESLLVEVPVTGTIDRPIDSECVSVRRSPESIDADYFPRDMAARVDGAGGSPRILLTTRSAIRQPLIEFRVSIACGYNLSHDYLLMASPRREVVQQPVATATRPDSPVSASVSGSPAQTPTSVATAVSAPVQSHATGSLPDGISGKSLVLDKDMTLEQLARKHFPGPLRQGRFMRWVAEANPHLFGSSKQLRQHKLSAGQELVIPNGVPPRRPGDYQNGLTPLGEPMTAEEVAAATATPARRKAEQSADESAPTRSPAVPSDGRKDRLVVSAGSGAKRDDKEAIALVDRLTGMMEQQVAAQSANDEKIRQLEATIADLGKTIAKMEKDSADREARWQTERLAEKTARENEEKQDWWQLLLAVAAGGLLGAGLLQGIRMLGGRRKPAADTIEGFPSSMAAESVPSSAEKKEEADLKSPTDTGRTGFREDVLHLGSSAAASRPEAKPAAEGAHQPKPLEDVLPASFFESDLDEHPTRSTVPLPTIDFEPPRPTPALAPTDEAVPTDPATAAIELANIMTSMGLGQSAAQTLVEHIRDNPRQSLHQWLKLLEIHRMNGNRLEFEKHAGEVKLHFNVQPDEWDVSAAKVRASLEDYPHIRSQLVKLWRKPQAVPILQALLMDNREGTRAGFPQTVAEEILLLLAISNSDAA